MWQRKQVRALLLPAVVTLDVWNRIIFTGAKMLRKGAFSGGSEGVTAELLMIKTWLVGSFMKQPRNRGILSFTHAEAQQAEAAGASSRPPDWRSHPAFIRSKLFHGHGSVRACVFSTWSYRLTADAQRDELIGDGAYCHGCGTGCRRGCLLLAAGGN